MGSIDVYVGSLPPSGETFPLSVDATGRHLVTASGDPFFIVADSPQALFVNTAATDNVTSTDVGVYLAARQAQGFNTIWVNIVCLPYTFGRSDASTYDGILPFTSNISAGNPDITTPNSTYWARMDTFVDLVTAYGFLLVIDPMETGGWLGVMENNGEPRCSTYGTWIGARYADYTNIAWMSGNDFQNWGATHDPCPTAIAEGIRTSAPTHLQTVQLDYFNSGSLDDATWEPLIDLNASYAYAPQYLQLLTDYNRANFIPNFMVEGSYEGEQNSPGDTPFGDPLEIRRQLYYSVTSGATGCFYGEHNTSRLLSGWEDWLGAPNAPGADHVGIFATWVQTVAWHELIPDQANDLLTSSFGTSGTTNYATAALNAAGDLAVIYIPFSTNVHTDLTQMSGSVTAQWFDPTNGAYTSAGSGLTGAHTFTHPGNNSGGDPDRVLILQA